MTALSFSWNFFIGWIFFCKKLKLVPIKQIFALRSAQVVSPLRVCSSKLCLLEQKLLRCSEKVCFFLFFFFFFSLLNQISSDFLYLLWEGMKRLFSLLWWSAMFDWSQGRGFSITIYLGNDCVWCQICKQINKPFIKI